LINPDTLIFEPEALLIAILYTSLFFD